MPRVVKCGLIQAIHACSTAEKLETIREANVAKHLKLIEQAGREGVQILCMQEIFTGPYFCAEQNARWYDSVESDPRRPDHQADAGGRAASTQMVIVVPLYEEDGRGHLLQHRGRHRRRRHVPRQVPEEPHPPLRAGVLGEVLLPARATSAIRSSRRSTPMSASTSATTAISRKARASSGSTARRSSSTPRPRSPDCPSTSGSSSSRRTRWRTRYFVGAINRVGYEEPWNIGEFYGQSYFCDPRGQIVAQASRDKDELVTAELDLDKIREVRNVWQFFRDRRPETYGGLTKP